MSRKLTTISLFTGAGGLDLGLEAAGFETCIAVDSDPDSVSTIQENREWPIIGANIHDVPSSELLKAAELQVGEADLVVGGPPCQPFSKSGYWARGDSKRLNDPRASTLEAYLRVLRDVQPKAFLLENVPGLNFSGKNEGVLLLQTTVASINKDLGTQYSLSIAKLNAADFGVPQERERVFIVGSRDGRPFAFPTPTHSPAGVGGSGLDLEWRTDETQLQPYRTAWDAIGDLQDDDSDDLQLTGKWADLVPSIPEGCNYLFHTDRGFGQPIFGWRTRYWSFLLKLSKRLPSWTITAAPGAGIGPFHWRNRKLSTRELCRLQTVPDSYSIKGNAASARRQLGNAVPSAIAERLGLEIRAQFLGEPDAAAETLTLVPLIRDGCPEPEPIHAIPPKYRHLVGAYAPHPGTGRGPGAMARAGG
jgi:DNA (cytosine-5)-methyltransferase 1